MIYVIMYVYRKIVIYFTQNCIALRVKKILDNICLTDKTEYNVEPNIVIPGAAGGFRIPAVSSDLLTLETDR